MTVDPQTIRFLSAMFPAELFEDGHRCAIWTFPDKRTRWAASVEEAAEKVASSATDQNVYFGLGSIRKPPAKGRGKESDVTAITSLYLDIDIDDGKVDRAKAERLPKTKKDAKAIIADIGLAPSLLVNSGHGFQAYWLFKEPWILDSDSERTKAKNLSRAWNATARLCAENMGFTLDMVFDLARVFRVPGSMNRKSEPHVPCTLVEPEEGESIRYYVQDDFDTFIVPESLRLEGPAYAKRAVVQPVKPVLPRADAGVPPMITVMMENDSRFKKTWERSRSDFSDQSASSYDMAIANAMVMAGAQDQQISDAIFQWRVKHGEDPGKAQRRDYVMRTISAARSMQVAQESVQDLVGMSYTTSPAAADAAADPDLVSAEREKILNLVAKATGIPVVKIVKHGSENSIYSFTMGDGQDVTIGSTEAILSQDKVRCKIAEATAIVLPIFKKETWHRQVGVMLRAAELIENDESTREGMISEWLRRYLNFGPETVYTEEIWQAALTASDPFVREGCLWIHCPSFRKFIRLDTGEIIERSIVHDCLRLIGFSTSQVSGKPRGLSVCRTYWRCDLIKLEGIGVTVHAGGEVETDDPEE